ncbi:MAG: sulfatase-like hydrolase/transferase [Flavobacteriales bacterium]|nr:sulfatase-like hydrolase/transferase [Flavobacteriales bacterium]
MHRFRGPLLVLLARLGAVALIYTLLRITFVLLNHDSFPNVPFAAFRGGVRFDLSALAWLNIPWLLLCLLDTREEGGLSRLKKFVFHLVNAVGFFFACVDLEFFKFTLRRSTADIFGIMSSGGDTGNLAGTFVVDYWYILLIFLVCIALAELGYRGAKLLVSEQPLSTMRRITWRIVAVGIVMLLSRGGTQLIPLGVMNAADHVAPAYFPVVLNTPFTIMMTIGKPVVQDKNYMSQKEADRLWPVVHHYAPITVMSDIPSPSDSTMNGAMVGGRPNVVVIILESFSAAYSAELTGGTGYMPFLDSLMRQSLNYTKAYANGRRSIDGIPAITAAIPELMDEAFITSAYAQTKFTSLANVLGEEGYHTSFFHGGRNGTMGFDGFAKSAGYERYVGMNEYPGQKDYDGSWGIWDRPFLQFFATELGREQQPFFSTVFTLSSHHPYHLLPEDEKRFAGGTLKIHASLRYTDDALREFFATAAQQPWFANTLFVITADHTADIERTGQHYSEATDYHVPLLYFMPSHIQPRTEERVTQHIDILPTVLDLVGYDKPFFSFGKSALRDERMACMVTASTGTYLIIDQEGAVQIAGAQLDDDEIASGDARRDSLERQLQAAVQQFHNHLLKNELVLP